MMLIAGTRLGPYEILGPLGSGGMGEVYGARDSRLGRAVAIKVLPVHLAADERLRQRFEREARALAALSHPHICTLHDIGDENGVTFLVMERLEGETLAARLDRGPLPPAQAARYGMEIADALDRAHRRGVVHRDLKPANVMITSEGIKLLDFGLAQTSVNLLGTAAGGLSELPTQSQPLSIEGAIVGTLPYMAPEQLEGREADARTDLFALGAVLYEMVTGRRAFDGESSASVIAEILRAEPPSISALNPRAPAALERAVARCLAKDPEARWQSARDLQLELAWIAEAGSAVTSKPEGAPRRFRERLAWLATLAALAAALGLALLRSRSPEVPRRATRFTATPAQAASTFLVRVSPDGRYLSFSASAAGGPFQLWLRPLGALAARALPGTEGASWHFWSPDSRFMAFMADGKLKRVDVTRGTVRTLCPAPGAGPFRLGAWGRDGTILFRIDEAPGHAEGFFRVSAEGGQPTPLAVVDESGGAMLAGWPSFLPDGRHFLAGCLSTQQGVPPAAMPGICVVSLATGIARPLLDIASYSEYAPPGYLVYVEGSSLFARPFDADEQRLYGEPSRIADGLESWQGFGMPSFSLSSNGVLVYQGVAGTSRLVWKDRSGRALGEVGPPGIYEGVRLAPDERQAVVTLRDAQLGSADLWLIELKRNVATRFTTEGPDAGWAVWSPDGSRMVYSRPQEAPPFLHTKPLSGGAEEVLLASSGSMQIARDWSPDGRLLLFSDRHPTTGSDIWVLALEGGRTPTPLVRTPFREYLPSFSPDGRWIAYASDESGRPEVYLQPFASPGEKVRISTDGGTLHRWRRDGAELFYQSSDNRVMAVPVRLGARPAIGVPAPLFDLGATGPDVDATFDVSADGQRFLVIAPEPGATPGATVILDWTAELAARPAR